MSNSGISNSGLAQVEGTREVTALAFLARAGQLLAESLDYEETLANVARLSVPQIADWCLIYDLQDDGSVRRLAAAHADPADAELAGRIAAVPPPDPERVAPLIAKLAAGESLLFERVEASVLELLARDQGHLGLITNMGVLSAMGIPLIARGRFLGAIALVSSRSGRLFTHDDLELAGELARRAALAMDNAILFRTAQEEIAERRRAEEERNVLLQREQEARRELQQVIEAMSRAEVRLRRLFEANVVGIIVANLGGEIQEANEAFLRMIGSSESELHGGRVRWDTITPPEFAEADRKAIDELRQLGACRPYEKEFIRSDGSRVAVMIGAAQLEGTESLAVSFVVDLSVQKQTMSALSKSEERQRALLSAIPDLMFRMSYDGIFLDYVARDNDALMTPPSGFLGRNIAEVMSREIAATTMHFVHEVFRTGELQLFEYQMDIGGEGRYYEARVTASGTDEVMVIVRDVTDRRISEIQLHEAKELAEAASRAKDQFLAMLSHELRTPLSPVLAAVEAIAEEDLPPTVHTFIEIIERNVKLEARLIDDLLDLTRIEKGKLQLALEEIDAHQLLRNALEISLGDIQGKSLVLSVDLAAERHLLLGDPARLQQVFWNLIKNAVKFTPPGGTIRISSSNSERGRLVVEVADSGIGIEPDLLPRIFNAFEQGDHRLTSQFGGMGLGLAISRMLVDMHRGQITAASDGPGLGATFRVEFIARGEGEPTRPDTFPVLAPGMASMRRTLLVVDDHADTGSVMKLLLERRGYRVLGAASIREAMDVAEQEAFDLLISDIGLPDGTGIELLHRLQHRAPLKAIALSGYGMEEDIRRSHDAGFAAHLVKPVDFRQLQELIEKLVGTT